MAAAAALLFALGATAYYWPLLPDVIPTHSDFAGRIDGWGPKSTMWMLMGLAVAGYIGLSVVCRFPHTFNYPVQITEENAARQYQIALSAMRWLKLETSLLWCVVVWQGTQAALLKLQANSPVPLYMVLGAVLCTLAVMVVRSHAAR